MTLVVDASVAAQWVLPEPRSDAANALRRTGEPLTAPDLVYAEIGNAIWKRALRREMIHDCFYLALAERERAPLISADKRLIAAAKRVKRIEVRAL